MRKMFLIAAITIIGMMAINSQEASALPSGYFMEVTKWPCPGRDSVEGCVEVIRDAAGHAVYTESNDCDGNTTKTGEYPKGIIAFIDTVYKDTIITTLEDVWLKATRDRANDAKLTMAEALSRYIPAEKKDSVVSPHDTIRIYHFKFERIDISTANITFTEHVNSIDIQSDKPVKVQIVDLSTGLFATGVIVVNNSATISIGALPMGCRYAVIVNQTIEGYGEIIIATHEFCKAAN